MGLGSLIRIFIHFTGAVALSLSVIGTTSRAQNRTFECAKSFSELIADHESPVLKHPPIQIRTKMGVVLTQDEEAALRSQFDQLADLTQGRLKLPDALIIEVGPLGDEAAYLDGVISIPKEFVSTGYPKDPKITRTVISHEWGHALLEANIWERAPDLLLFSKEISSRGMQAATIINPYGELFADTVAVMEAKDGRATRDVLFSAASGNRGSESAHYRDFTVGHPVEGWSLQGPYALLSPARSALWDDVLSRPKAQRESGRTLEALVDSIVSESLRRWIPFTPDLTPEQINRGLIEEVSRRLH